MKYCLTPPNHLIDRVNMQTPKYNVFVYGTLKSGQCNHSLISPEKVNSQFIGSAVTCNESYVISCNGGFPMVQDTRISGANKYKIIGEIYKVDHKVLTRLDILEGNGRLYARTQRPFIVNLDGIPTEIPAWIYLFMGNLQYYEDRDSKNLIRYQGPNKTKLIEWSKR